LNSEDLYSVLGVLPNADDVVIRAAFKALAQRYHPDKWSGSHEQAHKRMASINEAYRVLGDPLLRAKYDSSRVGSAQRQQFAEDEGANAEAFSAALAELEERWSIACSIYPDLQQIRARLNKISTSLAFAYVTDLLELKAYAKRQEIATHLEHVFLERHFGSNANVLAYARELIFAGRRDALRALNRLVDVIGSDSDPDLLIRKVDDDFGLRAERERRFVSDKERQRIQTLIHAVKVMGYYDEARELGTLLGFQVSEVGGGVFSSPQIQVSSRTGEVQMFKNSAAFMNWARSYLCEGA
jgi:hypothetical protein